MRQGMPRLFVAGAELWRLYVDYGGNEELALADCDAMGAYERIVNAEIDTLLASEPETRAAQLAILRAAFIPWLTTGRSRIPTRCRGGLPAGLTSRQPATS